MKEILKLKKPIIVNGDKINELSHDADEITAPQFVEAESLKMKAAGNKGGNLAGAFELDYSLHLYLGFMAIIAINPHIDITDLEKIKGSDIKEIIRIGRNFIMSSSEEISADDNSEEQ